MKVIFSHGKVSGPWGSKIQKLANIAKAHNCSVDSIDYSDILDPDLRVERLLKTLKNVEEDFVLVGSSIVAAEKVTAKGLFLLAPALFMKGYKTQNYSASTDIEIVHGWSDDVIPPENSIKFAKHSDCSLHLISGDHRLNTSIETVENLFSQFLKTQTLSS